jgi:nitric oxide synthase oxygenase domain/subunit
MHRRDPKAGWKGRSRFYANVLVDDGSEEPYVAIFSQGAGPKSATPEIINYAGETGSISNLNWKLKRTGTSTETNYSIIPLPTADAKPIDLDKFELFDLEKTAVRDVPYSEQESFYFGITSDSSAEPASATSSAIEW